MPEIKSLLTTVRKDLHSIGHRRNAYSLNYPYSPIRGSDDAASDTTLSEPARDHDTEAMSLQRDRQHTGTATCACGTCLMPGDLTYAEFEQHVARKIEAGRREAQTIDAQLAYCNELVKLLNTIDEQIRRLNEEPLNKPLPTPPIQDLDNVTPTPLARRRMTVQELPATSFSATRPSTVYSHMPASTTSAAPEQDVWTVVDSPSSAKHMGMVFEIPDRISSLETAIQEASQERPSTSSRLSKPFLGHWPNESSPMPRDYSNDSLEFDDEISEEAQIYDASDVQTERLYRPPHKPEFITTTGYRDGVLADSSPDRPKSTKKHNMPPSPGAVPRFTPRTESTADLLGGPVVHKFVSRDVESPKSPPASYSSFKDRNKGGLSLKSSTSIESGPSFKKKWNMFRGTNQERPHTADAYSPYGASASVGGLSPGYSESYVGLTGLADRSPSAMAPKRPSTKVRRHSKASILLGLAQSEPASRLHSAMGVRSDDDAASIMEGSGKAKRGVFGRLRRSRD